MIYLNEWLPNPTGSDTENEWIELYNNGSSVVDLSGWALVTKNGKTFYLKGYTIEGGEYLILPRNHTKLILGNVDEELFLYNSLGKVADRSSILGTAQEGKSWNRNSYDENSLWSFANPTPGKLNSKPDLALIENHYNFGEPLAFASISNLEIVGLTLGTAALITAFTLFAFKNHAYLQELFFHRN